MKKWIAFILVAVLALPVVAATNQAAKPGAKTPAKKTAPAKKLAKADFIIIESDVYAAGKEDPRLTQGIAQFLEVEPVVQKVPVAVAKTDAKYAGLDTSFLPLYLIKKTDALRAKLAQHIERGFIQESSEYIILPKQTPQGVYTDKKAQPGVMEIFVMSQCPYGVRAENLVIDAQKAGTFPADKQIRIRYIVGYDEVNGFNSLHGSGEWEEDVRQLLIAKYYPSKFWKYLEIRNKDYRSSRWDKAMEQAGINAKKIMKKFDSEGLELLKQEAAYTEAYGIGASPSFLWEGQVKLDMGAAAEVDGFGFLSPRAVNSRVPAAPAGQC